MAPVIYFLVVSFAISYFMFGFNFVSHPSQYFSLFGYLGGTLILLYPVVAIFLYFVTRISWYIFIVHGILVVIENIYRISYHQHTFYHLAMLGFVLIFSAIVLFALQKNFRSPYFHVIARSFRRTNRIPIDHQIQVDGTRYRVNDFSDGGCFIPDPKADLKLGKIVAIQFKSEKLHIACRGEVVRSDEDEGFGIRFLDLNKEDRNDINNMIINRYSIRYEVNIPCTWEEDDIKQVGALINISAHGCFIQADGTSFNVGDQGIIRAAIGKEEVLIIGVIKWIQPQEKDGKPSGIGIRYKRAQSKLLHHITEKKQIH
jgi:hypothetical protein